MKRFVLLGSAVAVLDSSQNTSCAGKPYTEEDWNPVGRTEWRAMRTCVLTSAKVTAASAIESKSAVLGYNASKKLAERAAWDFLAGKRPAFDLTVINPDIINGPMLQPIKGPENVNKRNSFAVYDFLNGKYKQIEGLYFPFYYFACPLMPNPFSLQIAQPKLTKSLARSTSATSPSHISSRS